MKKLIFFWRSPRFLLKITSGQNTELSFKPVDSQAWSQPDSIKVMNLTGAEQGHRIQQ
jgi:hypothetical protein